MAILIVLVLAVAYFGLYLALLSTQEGRKLQRARIRAQYGNAGAWYGRTNRVW
jgi:hypothetical protein